MVQRGIIGSFYTACEWIVRLAYVNVLWVGFTLMGFVVFGIFPATVAAFTISRKWINGESDIPIFRQFWQTYKKEFLQSNLLGLIIFIIGSILYFDLYFFYNLEGLYAKLLFYLFVALAVNYGVMLLHIFPIYVHYDLKRMQYLKYALIIGMSNPFHTFSMVLILIFLYFLLDVAPAASLFFSMAPLSYMYMLLSVHIHRKLEQKKQLIESV
ncbi:MAG: YesL family protein [Bacillaceae bacterium]|nr:YesL family protein [Bacillaceae bacterium]